MIPMDYVEEICLIGQGEATCAFLMMGAQGWDCAKGTGFENIIWERLAADTINAQGDNCDGWGANVPPT